MHESALARFRSEIRHFYVVTVANIVFAALVMAFGISVIVGEAGSMYETFSTAQYVIYSPVVLFVALVAVLTGLRWILTSIGVFEGIEAIKDDLDGMGGEVPDEALTRLIVSVLAHYRDNRATIRTMILVCTLGGVCSFFLGVAVSLEHLSVSPDGIAFTINNYLVIPSLLTLCVALVSLASSYYFSRFAKVWDERLDEIMESEALLKETLELDRR
ncbi:hypothetical protein [Methanoculleus horonobensis]|jgi:hypothetical protein|uniref:hypothetical protein n=1 Tax=Methanoculleus horonobensis TaxID=528314 RepID=UPI000831D8BD|nr:hypothetical protein [Methanoculleus horonobensis]MDD3071905.1 hypothetical protein [Methanoculleus horonobensis]MDD4253383.1 hypothetical protein [Methanoculleus horonobensis]